MVGRSDEHDVQLMSLKHFAIIVVGARFFAGGLSLARNLDRATQHILVRIAEGDHFRRRHLD